MTPSEKAPRKGLEDDTEKRPLPGRKGHETRAESRGIAPDPGKSHQVRDKPYPQDDTEADISGVRSQNAYHETGGVAGRLDRENEDTLPETRRESRTRVSPENPEEPTQEPSGKHTNQ